MNKNRILALFESRSWIEIAGLYAPSEVASSLSFKNGLQVGYQLLYNQNWDESLQQYAVELFYKIREVYLDMWDESWEYDALLGLACYITSRHEERYESYKRAFDKSSNPPPRLLIELARCCICPGKPPITYEQALDLVTQALKDCLYLDGVGLLCNIYSLKKEEVKKQEWLRVLENSEGKPNSPCIELKFLTEGYAKEAKDRF